MNFISDQEKMRDYWELTKEEFLFSYSYLTEEEYEETREIVGDRDNVAAKLRYLIARVGLTNEEIYVWQDDNSTIGIDVDGEPWSSYLDPAEAESEVRCLLRGYLLGKTIA